MSDSVPETIKCFCEHVNSREALDLQILHEAVVEAFWSLERYKMAIGGTANSFSKMWLFMYSKDIH